MPDPAYLVGAVVISVAITWGLRAIPFAVLAPLRRSRVLPYLGAYLPVGVMAILVVYTLRDTMLTVAPFGAPAGIAVAATVALHAWRGQIVLSIVGGTIVHVVLVGVL